MKGDSDNRKYIIWFWIIYSIPFAVVIALFILISNEKLGPMPSFDELENPEYFLAAEVYSEDEVLLGKISIENRTWTDYKELSPYLIDALIATEDIRYYRHSGIDIRGLARAFVRTILLGQDTGGGSTITQQLAKQLYPRDTAKVSFAVRKIRLGITKFKEWQTAVKLEKSYTKEEIIAMYLNKYDFLYQAIGIQSAARVYFNTTPDSLNIQEAAVLVGMLILRLLIQSGSCPLNSISRLKTIIQVRQPTLGNISAIQCDGQNLTATIMYGDHLMKMLCGNGRIIRFTDGAIKIKNLTDQIMIYIKMV
jgi:membrane peptidoglycan carboxypeptidase